MDRTERKTELITFTNPIFVNDESEKDIINSTPKDLVHSKIPDDDDDEYRPSILNEDLQHNGVLRTSVNSSGAQDIFNLEFTGLYTQYIALGLLLGSSATAQQFCYYYYEGEPSVCNVSGSIISFPTVMKIFMALIVDYFPIPIYGLKAWMCFAWMGVIVGLLVLSIGADSMSVSSWLGWITFTQAFMNLAYVPCDGLSVQFGKMETTENRGKIISQCQVMKYAGTILFSIIQTFLLNSQSMSYPGCPISTLDCWKWGLSIRGFYGVLLAVTVILIAPIYWLKLPILSHENKANLITFVIDIYNVTKNAAFFYVCLAMILFNLGFLQNYAHIYLEFEILEFSNVEFGINNLITTIAITSGIWFFKAYLMKVNWRLTYFVSIAFYLCVQLLWLPAYYNSSGTLNVWYIVFLDWDGEFAAALTAVITSLIVIEIAVKGLEATTFEMLGVLIYSAQFANTIISEQVMNPLGANLCESDTQTKCVTPTYGDIPAFVDSSGPKTWAIFSVVIICIQLGITTISISFLPGSIEECKKLKSWSNSLTAGNKRRVAATMFAVIVLVSYAVVSSALLMDSSTSCLKFVGGDGCPANDDARR
jgi:hypothetical protein